MGTHKGISNQIHIHTYGTWYFESRLLTQILLRKGNIS